MKVPAGSIYSRVRSIPSVKFEPDSPMTSFGGLVIFQPLFERLDLWRRLSQCCAHLPEGGLYSHALCRNVIQRAARLTCPQGKWTLTLPDIPSLRAAILRYAA